MTWQEQLEAYARAAARAHNLDEALVLAICEQESSWNCWGIRYEPAFFGKYVAPLYTANKISTGTEAYTRAMSWGLMQLMGQVARELGFEGSYLSQLCDPQIGLEWGCKHFANKLHSANGDTRKALQLWNGGGNPDYADQVIARVHKYNPESAGPIQVEQAACGDN